MQGAASLHARLFKNGELLPYSALFVLKRKDLLFGIKQQMPFWHSIPLVAAVIKFFKNLGKKKNVKKQGDSADSQSGDEFVIVGQEQGELQRSARMVESAIVPDGKTIDEYLAELEGRWVQLIDKKARQNLIVDVQSLLRDNLRSAMKVYKLKRITRDGLREMVDIMINRSHGLQNVRDREALHLYMELFMLKMLLQRQN